MDEALEVSTACTRSLKAVDSRRASDWVLELVEVLEVVMLQG